MKNLKVLALILALNFVGHASRAQTCDALFTVSPPVSAQAWTEWVADQAERQGSIHVDLESATVTQSKHFRKLTKYFAELAAKPEKVNFKNIDQISSRISTELYDIAKNSEDEKSSLANLDSNKWLMKRLHKRIFIELMTEDLNSGLKDFAFTAKKPNVLLKPVVVTKALWSHFYKKHGAKVRLGFWASIHVPMALFGHFMPIYLVKKGDLKISEQTKAMVRDRLQEGDFNAALKSVEPELRRAYKTRFAFDQAYGLIHLSYNAFNSLVLAHVLLSSSLMTQLSPEFANVYNQGTAPVIELIDKSISPAMNAIERLYTHRETFEKLIIAKSIEQKEEILGHKILPGSPEYIETKAHVEQLDLETLEQFYNSLSDH